ncbi:MAG: PH domain-containing protein, partial [Thermoplasmata archaeon]
RAAYLSSGEGILREGRATRLYYLPAPIFWLIVIGLFDYSALAAQYASDGWAAFPGLTTFFAGFPAAPKIGAYDLLGWTLLVLAFFTLLLFLWLGIRYLRWRRTIYAVTTNRVIIQRGILSRDFDEIPVTKVRAIEVHQSFPQRMLGYGTIRVTAEGVNRIANEDWKGIPRPWEFQKYVDAAAQRYNQR